MEQKYHLAITSHKRPQNVQFMQKICEGNICNWYVINGEKQDYLNAGAHNVYETLPGISIARNTALRHAFEQQLPSIQLSDDLRNIKKIRIENGKRIKEFISFNEVCQILISELIKKQFYYGGVAVTSNPLNYTGIDISYEKLIVCDLNCFMPGCPFFDEELLQKEDYDMTIRNILQFGGVVRLDNILCDFPHRQNDGGANTYRNFESEKLAMEALIKKWPNYLKHHNTRENQVSLIVNNIFKDRPQSEADLSAFL